MILRMVVLSPHRPEVQPHVVRDVGRAPSAYRLLDDCSGVGIAVLGGEARDVVAEEDGLHVQGRLVGILEGDWLRPELRTSVAPAGSLEGPRRLLGGAVLLGVVEA